MAGNITVSSTTDNQQAVDAAAQYNGPKSSKPEVTSGNYAAEEIVEQPSEAPEAESEVSTEETKTESEQPEEEEEEEPPTSKKEEGDEEEEEEGEEEPPAARGARDKRMARQLRQISRLTGQRYQLREQLDAANERLRQYEQGKQGPQSEDNAVLRKPDPNDPKYKDKPWQLVEDLADFKVLEREQIKAQQAQERHLKQVFDDYNHELQKARDRHEDFDEVVNRDAEIPKVAIKEIYELDNGPDVAYYLGKHPEVREQLLEWNDPALKGGYRKIVVELNRISELLSSPPKKPSSKDNGSPRQQPKTPTPEPIKPLGGASATRPTNVDPGSMDYQAYKRWHANYMKTQQG